MSNYNNPQQYNHQQQYYNFQQHTPGPPQPQWQAAPPRRGWGDPRLSLSSPAAQSPAPPSQFNPQAHTNPNAPQSIPPPPPPPPSGFSAASQNSALYDTSAWGVRYNQNQQYNQSEDALRPSLPPRPPSAVGGGYGQQWNGQSQYTKPPTPPPRPVEYSAPHQSSQNQYYPHDQYSHRPSSHQYEPTQNQWTQQPSHSSSSWSQTYHQNETTSSQTGHNAQSWQAPSGPGQDTQQQYTYPSQTPQATPTQQSSIPKPSASALGVGAPSDWEHFPGDGHYYHNQIETQQLQQEQQHQHRPSAGSGHQGVVSTPDTMHAVPVNSEKPPRTNTPGTQSNQGYNQESNQRLSPQHGQSPSLSSLSSVGYYNQGRTDSTVSSVSQNTPQRTGTIDSVIQAWNTPSSTQGRVDVEPLRSSSRPSTALKQSAPIRELSSVQTQTDFPPIVKTETRIETREIDPYEDLKNEYRTSLNRYATMLRQEMAASNETEKLKIVTDYVNREIKLRSILFNAEPSELVRSNELVELRKSQEELVRLKKSQEEYRQDLEHSRQDLTNVRHQKDELKTQLEQVNKQLDQSKKEIVDLKDSLAAAKKKDEEKVASPASTNRAVTPKPKINTNTTSHSSGKEDSFVMIGADGEDVEYSPGGRPKMSMPTRTPTLERKVSLPGQESSIWHQSSNEKVVRASSPSDNAPMVVDDYFTPGQPVGIDRSFTPNPQLTDRAAAGDARNDARQSGPIDFQPARPAYTPFRYSETPDPATILVNPDHPVNEAYTKLRHEQATDSGRLLNQEPPLLTVTPAPDRTQTVTPSRARQQHEEAFLGLLRQQSKATRKPSMTNMSDAPSPLRAGTPLKRRQSIPPLVKTSESLRQSLPNNVNQLTFARQTHPKIAPISSAVVKILDDFTFIHATVVGWDKENRKLRQRLDSERAARESETQAHIDGLFNDNEIGYADIAGLEEDSKLEEASKKYNEDQQELESFTRSVFDVVTQRLEGEVQELETLQAKTLVVLDDGATQSVSSRIRLAVTQPHKATDGAPLVDVMTTLLQIYQKIEARHIKIAEAQYERERRRKRLELSVLYTNGDTSGVKKLEKDFDRAQAMQVLTESRKRDDRANKLMDCFDRAVVLGLSENQEWVDDMTNKASLLRDLVFGAESNGPSQGFDREELLYGPNGITATMSLLQDAVGIVMQDSRDLVSMSSQADKILNEADFAMFLAEAKIAASDEKEFDKLNYEKTKEDQRLKDEAEARMGSVIKGPEEILGFVKDVTDTIGRDKDHKSRLNHALEAAKKRNSEASLAFSPVSPVSTIGRGLTPPPAPAKIPEEPQHQQLQFSASNVGRPTMREV